MINRTLCGVPQPAVQAKFIDQEINAATVNGYTHNFTLPIPRLTQTSRDKNLKVNGSEHYSTLTDKSIILKSSK